MKRLINPFGIVDSRVDSDGLGRQKHETIGKKDNVDPTSKKQKLVDATNAKTLKWSCKLIYTHGSFGYQNLKTLGKSLT